jgi:hypothetical protein
MSMAATVLAARHVIEVVDTLNREWDVAMGLDGCETALRVRDTPQLDDPGRIKAHPLRLSVLGLRQICEHL